jgi:hypothetical protein
MARQTASNTCSLRAEVNLAMMGLMEVCPMCRNRVRLVLLVCPHRNRQTLRQHLALNTPQFNSVSGLSMFKMTRSHDDFLIQFTLFSMGRPRCDFLREVSAVAIEWVYGRDDLLEQVRFEREVAVPTSKCTTARFTGRPSEAARFGWMETC